MIANLIPYSEMKDSGIEWCGEVPAHWEVTAVGRHFTIQLWKMLQTSPNDPADIEVSYLKAQHVQWFQVRTTDAPQMWASPNDRTQFGIAPGDLLVCEGGEGGRCGIVKRKVDGYIIQNALHRVRPCGQNRNDYLQYMMSAVAATNWFVALNDKTTIAHFTRWKFAALRIPIPPFEDQAAIVRYLDHTDRRIRRYIRAKQKLITLLEEKKQAIIHQAVTRGLDPNVRLKPSGVELRGERPERQWEPIKIKYLSSLKGRLGWQGLKAIEYTSEGPYVVSSAHFRDHKINWEICPHVTRERYEMDENIQLAQGDILLMKDGAAMGKLAFVDELPGLACLNSHLLLFRPLANDQGATYFPQFMFFYMQVECFQGYVQVNGTGATFLGISQESIGNHKVCLPSRAEQVAIVEHLDAATAAIDTTICSANRQIELLGEYRTRLIADVVTGKLDVREAAAGLPEVDSLANEFDGLTTQAAETGMLDLEDATETPEELAMENEVII